MSKVSVFDHGWIDLVFEGRNQEYGAYQLRKQDPKTTMLALACGIGLVVTLITIPFLINRFGKETSDVISCPIEESVTPLELVELPKAPEIPKPEPIVEEPAGAAAQSNVPTIEFKPLAPTSEPTQPVVTSQELTTSLPSNVTTEGSGREPAITGPGTAPSGTGPAINGTSTEAGKIETFVDVAPLYPGGLEKFYKDVANRFDTSTVENASSIKVLVSFVVEPDGTLSNIKATRDPGYGMGAEAVRVLKSLKAKWKPGMKSGKAVRTAYSLPITIKVH